MSTSAYALSLLRYNAMVSGSSAVSAERSTILASWNMGAAMKTVSTARLCAALVIAVVALGVCTASAFANGGVRTYSVPMRVSDVCGDIAVGTTQGVAPSPIDWTKTPTSIVLTSLSTGQVTQAVSHDAYARSPRISSRYVVWTAMGPGADYEDVYGYDMQTKTEFEVATGTVIQTDPDVDGDYAVWVETPGYNSFDSHIRGMNLRTGQRFDISNGSGIQTEPKIANGWVIYTATHYDTNAKAYIRLYQIATGRTYTLAGPSAVHAPEISNTGLVVWFWQDSKGDKTREYGCSVYNRKSQLLAPSADGWGAKVTGNMEVFVRRTKSGQYQLWGYDLDAGTRFEISPFKADLLDGIFPLSDGRVAWVKGKMDDSNGGIKDMVLSIAQPTVIGTYSAADPFASAVTLSQDGFPQGADRAVVANGGNWDEVTLGAGVAGDDAPLLLTHQAGMTAPALSELGRLAPKLVQVIGGTSSVSDQVVAQIASVVPTDTVIERVGGGSAENSSLSALESIASTSGLTFANRKLATTTRSFDGTVLVVGKSDKVMSGIAASVARGAHAPIVFVGSSIGRSQLDRMKRAGVTHVLIVGGTRGVSSKVERDLRKSLGSRSVARIAGKDSYATSARLAEYAVRHLGMTIDGVGIATNIATGDLLMAALKNGSSHGLLLLTGAKKLAGSASQELKARRGSIRRAAYIGRGSRLVSKAVRKSVRLIVR
jgi:putative cell wall-binding protein